MFSYVWIQIIISFKIRFQSQKKYNRQCSTEMSWNEILNMKAGSRSTLVVVVLLYLYKYLYMLYNIIYIAQVRLYVQKTQTEISLITLFIFIRFEFTQITQVSVHYFKSFSWLKSAQVDKVWFIKKIKLKFTQVELLSYFFKSVNWFSRMSI